MRRISLLCVVCALCALSTATVTAADFTVGSFLVEIAKVRQSAATDPEAAERSLRAEGFAIPTIDLGKSLTEGDVATIAGAMGLRVTTRTPASPVSREQAGAFVTTFGNDLVGLKPQPTAGTHGEGPPREDPNPGKGKSKGFTKSPSEPL